MLCNYQETRWIGTEMRDHPTYDGTSYLIRFLIDIDGKFEPEKRISVLDIALKDTQARWWATHRASLLDWEDAKRSIRYRFLRSDQVTTEMNMDFCEAQLFDGQSDPRMHVEKCIKKWKVVQVPYQVWVHLFFHSLGAIPKT
jgi:hypothetical protein